MNRFIKKFLLGIFIFFLFLEIYIILSFRYPIILPHFLIEYIKILYKQTWRCIQFEPHCTKYDEELTYVLNPGQFIFSNVEFRNVFKVNSLGFRDDEESLKKPDIIIIGDSFAMGWGVEQEETFANIIEKRTGLKVLNTAISSYGTVREMKTLDRVDTSNLKYLIIQYCENDYDENKVFFENRNFLPISSKEDFITTKKRYKISRCYFPFKYSILFLDVIRKYKFTEHNFYNKYNKVAEENERLDKEIEYFLNAIMNASKVNLEKVKIILLCLGVKDENNFFTTLTKKISLGKYPFYIKEIKFVYLVDFLSKDKYNYFLDSHLNSIGHKIVAEQIISSLQKLENN